jgi:enoyl-CoA hydratase/carnithine racemase
MISDGHLAYDAMPGGGATRRLPARLGYSGALLFLLRNEILIATEAARIGIVDETVPAGQAPDRGRELAASLAAVDASVAWAAGRSLII